MFIYIRSLSEKFKGPWDKNKFRGPLMDTVYPWLYEQYSIYLIYLPRFVPRFSLGHATWKVFFLCEVVFLCDTYNTCHIFLTWNITTYFLQSSRLQRRNQNKTSSSFNRATPLVVHVSSHQLLREKRRWSRSHWSTNRLYRKSALTLLLYSVIRGVVIYVPSFTFFVIMTFMIALVAVSFTNVSTIKS